MAKTAFVVRVPEAEVHVRELRERFDPSARLGVPAHITILVPFMAPEQLNNPVLAAIAGAFSQFDPFTFELKGVGRFHATAYLVPDPAEPFIALTNALLEMFPDFPPYGGAYASVVPHLTVADGDPARAEVAERQLTRLMESRGPIHGTCGSVTLMEDSTGRWEEIHAFALRQREG
jgi:2'-5' RNA ligase